MWVNSDRGLRAAAPRLCLQDQKPHVSKLVILGGLGD
jgi:hypothetical protein